MEREATLTDNVRVYEFRTHTRNLENLSLHQVDTPVQDRQTQGFKVPDP